MQKNFPLTLLAICIGAAVAASAGAEDLTQIYQQAYQADPTLATASANKGISDAGVGIARAPLLPQLGASLGYAHSDSRNSSISAQATGNGDYALVPSVGSSQGRSRTAQGTLTQTLFNWGDISRLRGARETARGADASYDAAVQDLIVRTATAYFGVLTADDQLTFAQSNQKALEKQLDQAEQRFKVGLSAITDVQQARANYDSAVAQTIQAQNGVDTARESLEQITGRDFGDLKKLRDDLPLDKPSPDNLQAWVDLALKQSPVLASSNYSLNAAQDNVSASRAGHLPTLSASLVRTDTPSWGSSDRSFGSAALNIPGNGWSGDTTIGVTLNVPLFSGGLVHSQVRQAIYQRDAAQDQLEFTRRGVVASTRNAYRAVLAGISEVEANKQAVLSAQKSLEATEAGFEVGTQTIVNVLLAQQAVFQAQSAYSLARHQFVISGLQLKQAAGEASIKDIEAVNALLQ
ncbi:MAG: TolC family outer membrane protein [Proteobacteria bacterium]|nr:TolC family outer membrane protein [Pseudomonadota bacterium]